MNHTTYITVDSIEDVEVVLHEDTYGDLHFVEASIGQFILYTTPAQRETLLKLAKAELAQQTQEARDDVEIDLHFLRNAS